MTILPVKKKREKDSTQKPPVPVIGNDPNRPPSSQSSSSGKRARPADDGPPLSKSWAISSVAHSPRHDDVAKKPKMPSPSGGADYNSDDEYQPQNERDDAIEADFVGRLSARGLIIKEMVGDGACMFRAIAEQVYGDQEMHGQIRALCMNYMSNNKDHFKEFITENFENYIQRKRADHVHGNHVELQAISEMFARPVEVYQYSEVPINVLLPRPEPAPPADGPSSSHSSQQMQQNAPLRLSYHGAVHYNAILAPNEPTIGVGLGLPGMVPGAADKDLMTRAIAKSELEHIEEAMLQDKIGMTDFQRTQADLEEQIARESLMSYFKDLENKGTSSSGISEGPSTSAAASSSSTSTTAFDDKPNENRPGLYEELLAAQSLDWGGFSDDGAIADALLLSQQDYLMSTTRPGPSDRPSE